MNITASIREQGNGWPERGDYVRGDDGETYRVLRCGSRIETGRPGQGNVCLGYVLQPAEWDDLEDDQIHPCLALVTAEEDAS